MDMAGILQLSHMIARIPADVRVNQAQCQLLADRVSMLAGHVERMQGIQQKQQLEKNHEDVLTRTHALLVECRDFMHVFMDGFWMKRALYREEYKGRFKHLHESITYILQILHLEIDYHSFSVRSVEAEAADVENMEKQLALVATKMEKLEVSMDALTDENKKQHDAVMAALKDIRVYRKTLNQDQVQVVLAEARAKDGEEPGDVASLALKAKQDTTATSPIPSENDSVTSGGASAKEALTPELPPKATRKQRHEWPTTAQLGAKQIKCSEGPSLHLKPFSQSYGVGLARSGIGRHEMTSWLYDDNDSANDGVFGDGGAKRGEYEVSFGEGQMGFSLKNAEGRAEVSRVESGGAANAAGVHPGDSIVGINGRVPLGYTQVMSILPTAARPIRIRFTRGKGEIISPGGTVKRTHASTWASNAVTAGVHHPAGDKGVLLEIFAKASFALTPWVRSEGWDQLPLPPAVGHRRSTRNVLSGETEIDASKNEAARDSDGSDTAARGSADADDLARWSGVRVGRSGKVIEIRLPGNNMNGVLPPSMGSLNELRTVQLRENRLEGNIPESLRYLDKLKTLDLAHNLLEGSIPPGEARWINTIAVLLLNNNKLSGHVPSSLGRLANLTKLDLGFNALSGAIPSELSGLRSLEVLSLAHNILAGSLPKPIGELARLKILNLSHNKLTGPLPRGLGRLSSLKELRIGHNNLSGHIPADAIVSLSLLVVDLSNNGLDGEIPGNLGSSLGCLIELDLSRNSLSGEIPSTIGAGCKLLKKLNLERNMLGGSLPTSLAKLKQLKVLSLGDNTLTGPLSHVEWANFCSLEHLDLSNNKLQESLPASLGTLGSLVSLSLNSNRLSGNIPRELHDLDGLKLLDLSGNKIAPSVFSGERRTLKKKLSSCDVRF